MIRAIRPRKCKTCGTRFTPRNSLHVVCSLKCSVEHGRKALASQQRKEKREGRERLMTARDLIPKAQSAFNKYIRLRDAKLPCVSCGRSNAEVQGSEGWKPGGAWDCGHWLSVGAYPNLRFEPDNAHKQCKSCNGGSNHYAGKSRVVSEHYELNIGRRIGVARMDELKADQTPRKYTIDELKALTLKYRAMANELKRQADREAA